MKLNDDIEILNGDCLELMKQIPDKSVDAVICDPPYETTACEWDHIIPADRMWEQYERIVKPKGNVVLFGAGLFAYKLALSNERKFRYELIWKKSKCGSPFTAKYMPMKKHENILVFGDSASYYEPQMTEGTPYHRKWTPNKNNNLKYGINGVQTDNKGTRHPTTVLDFPQKWRRQDQVHPTQKPVELCEYLIKTYTREGQVVADICAGSGTTAIAALNTGRRFIGFENAPAFYGPAAERIQRAREAVARGEKGV